MAMRLGDLLPKKLAKHGLSRPVLAAQVVSAWLEIATQIAPQLSKGCQAISLSKNNILSIRCTHAAVAAELALRQQEILALYKKKFPQLALTLRFQTGALVNQETDRL